MVSEARLENLLAHELAVHVELVDTEAGGHPYGLLHGLVVGFRPNEPARSVGSQFLLDVVNATLHYGCVDHRYPLRCLPSGIVQGIGALSYELCAALSTPGSKGGAGGNCQSCK